MPFAFVQHRKTLIAMALLGAGFALPLAAQAQEGVLHGLGWLTARPGSEVDGRSSAIATGNRAPAQVGASGG